MADDSHPEDYLPSSKVASDHKQRSPSSPRTCVEILWKSEWHIFSPEAAWSFYAVGAGAGTPIYVMWEAQNYEIPTSPIFQDFA
jgi:hypothetical protein